VANKTNIEELHESRKLIINEILGGRNKITYYDDKRDIEYNLERQPNGRVFLSRTGDHGDYGRASIINGKVVDTIGTLTVPDVQPILFELIDAKRTGFFK
jgi:hypothetical protein